MVRYKGGEKVVPGIYLNRKTGEIVNRMKTGGVLPADRDTEYIKIPAAAMLIFGPLIGLVYVVFLPFIAFGMLLWYGMDRLIHVFTPVHERVMGVAAPTWTPVEAYLDGKAKTASESEEDDTGDAPERDESESMGETLSDLEKEVDEKRKKNK